MLHAPTSETKTESVQGKSSFALQPERELHPQAFGGAGMYSPGGAGSLMPVGSPETHQRQVLNRMQSAYGNQAVLRILDGPQQVARTPALRPSQSIMLQRKCACGGSSESTEGCAECKEKREATLQRSSGNQVPAPAAATVPPIVHNVLSSPGQPLDASTRAFMEPRFGHDFSHVRIHTDSRAAESAQAVSALAYTVGRDVVFGAGQYVPGTSEGKKLMAHELTHVVQQEGNSRLITAGLAIGTSGDAFEQEAQTTAERVISRSSVSAAPATMRRSASEMMLRRQPKCPPTGPQQVPSPPKQLPTCPPALKEETEHPGKCPDVVRESGELDRFVPKVETITQNECYLIKNLRSGSQDLSMLKEWNEIATLLAALLKADSSAYLSIFGYSDCIGIASLNDALRWRRALEVQDYFVHKLKVDPEQIDFKAAEATKYVNTNNTPEGRARNRSVSILVMHSYVDPKEKPYMVLGLGKRKQEILDARGTELDLAIAMLETECMQADLAKGGYPPGDNKTGDAANFGIFKQNWFMLRTSVSEFRDVKPRYTDKDYEKGAILNGNLSKDINARHESQSYYGIDAWFAGHRNGPTGLKYPVTHDIATYRNTVYWIRDQIFANPKYRTDDTRVARTVRAI